MHGQAWECANKLGLIGPAMEQPQYNMFEREKVRTASAQTAIQILHHLGYEPVMFVSLLSL